MKNLYRPDEVAEILRFAKRSVYRFIASGRLRAVEKNGCRRIPAEELSCMGGELKGDRLLRPSEAAWRLGLSKSTIYRLFWEGKLRGVKLSFGPVRIWESSVKEQLEGGGG
jgi:excisionase family DNA binding protein